VQKSFKLYFQFGFFTSSSLNKVVLPPFFIEDFTQNEKENVLLHSLLSELPVDFNILPNIQEGMKLLKKDRSNKIYQQTALSLFKELADAGDPEASWRYAACLYNEWGEKASISSINNYAKIAMDANLAEGYFYCGKSTYDMNERLRLYKISSEKGLSSAHFQLAMHVLMYPNDRVVVGGAKEHFLFSAKSGDKFYLSALAYLYEAGKFPFKRKPEKAEYYQRLSVSASNSDCTFFNAKVDKFELNVHNCDHFYDISDFSFHE
jgi:hypothetical protein